MEEIIIAGVFTVIGAVVGFVGSVIQSKIAAKNNIAVVRAQAENEIEKHRYIEKEKLYSDLITFIPQYSFSLDIERGKINLSHENRILLNSFKARLNIYSNVNVYNEFYDLIEYLATERDTDKIKSRIDGFTDMLMEDLKTSKVE